jgi:hypothetical protein
VAHVQISCSEARFRDRAEANFRLLVATRGLRALSGRVERAQN